MELRDATLSLRPETKYLNPNESEDDRKQRKLARYTAAAQDLYLFSETRRPFIPELLVQALRALDQIAWREVVQYRHRCPYGEGYDPKYWDNALENSARIQAATAQCSTPSEIGFVSGNDSSQGHEAVQHAYMDSSRRSTRTLKLDGD